MPTKRPRHTVTETDALADVLEQLRRRSQTARIDFAELMRLGGEAKLQQLDAEERREASRAEARARFLARSRTGEGIDLDALGDVRRSGWSHD